MVIPFIGIVVLLYWLCLPSTSENNRFDQVSLEPDDHSPTELVSNDHSLSQRVAEQ